MDIDFDSRRHSTDSAHRGLNSHSYCNSPYNASLSEGLTEGSPGSPGTHHNQWTLANIGEWQHSQHSTHNKPLDTTAHWVSHTLFSQTSPPNAYCPMLTLLAIVLHCIRLNIQYSKCDSNGIQWLKTSKTSMTSLIHSFIHSLLAWLPTL